MPQRTASDEISAHSGGDESVRSATSPMRSRSGEHGSESSPKRGSRSGEQGSESPQKKGYRSGEQGSESPQKRGSPLQTARMEFRPGSWIARTMNSSWRHTAPKNQVAPEEVRAVEPDDDPTVDWIKVLQDLQVERKRAAAKKSQKYINRSCYLFESNTPFRESVINLVEWHWFDRVVLCLILANCCFLVLDDPVCRCLDDLDCTEKELYARLLYSWDCSGWPAIHNLLTWSEIVFTALFTLEMFIKIIARGFILHKHAFLRDGWNWIDFIVVVTSLISQVPALSTSVLNPQMLRTVRVLRPLRTMTRIKGMRPLVNTFLRSFRALGNVILLLFFFFCVFGILGIELLTGALRGRCFIDPTAEIAPGVRAVLESQQTPYVAAPANNVGGWNGNVGLCSVGGGGAGCDAIAIDGVEYATVCSNKKWCETGWCEREWVENPVDFGLGFFSYDNFAASWLVIFQVLTVEGWTEILYMYEDGFQKWGARIFFTAWVLIGTFFVVQLALAVLANSFVLALEEERIHKAREAMDEDSLLRPTRAMARRFTMFKSRRETSFARGLESAHKSMQQSFFASFNWSFVERAKGRVIGTPVRKAQASGLSLWCEYNVWGPGTCGGRGWARVQQACRILVRAEAFSQVIIVAILLNTLCLALDFHDQPRYEADMCRRRCELDAEIPAGWETRCEGPLFNRTYDSDGRGGGVRRVQSGESFCLLDDWEGAVRGGAVRCAAIEEESECYAAEGGGYCWWAEGRGCRRGLYSAESFVAWGGGELSLRHLCGDTLGQCETYDRERAAVFESINAVLTFLFITEMVLKMVGLGIFEYFDDQFNQFDFFVVMASIFELIVNALDSESGQTSSSISALRGMRLFRLFKLARSWKSMRKILKTLGIALGSLGPLTVIWVMFMYIFALLGMQYFGGSFRAIKTASPRSNFDSFFPSELGHGAFLVTFQIITSENWNTIAYDSIRTAGPAGALPAILVVLFGNYIIMNLFISILLQGFAEDGFEDDEEAPAERKSLPSSTADAFRKLLGRLGSGRVSPFLSRAGLGGERVTAGHVRRASDGLAALSDPETSRRASGLMPDLGAGAGLTLDPEGAQLAVALAAEALKEREEAEEAAGKSEAGGSVLVRNRAQAGNTPLPSATSATPRSEDLLDPPRELTPVRRFSAEPGSPIAGSPPPGAVRVEAEESEEEGGGAGVVVGGSGFGAGEGEGGGEGGGEGAGGQGGREGAGEVEKMPPPPVGATTAPPDTPTPSPDTPTAPPTAPTAPPDAAAAPSLPPPPPPPPRVMDLASTSQRPLPSLLPSSPPPRAEPIAPRPVSDLASRSSPLPRSGSGTALSKAVRFPSAALHPDKTLRTAGSPAHSNGPDTPQPAAAPPGGGGGGGGKMMFTSGFLAHVGEEDLEEAEVTWMGRTFAMPNHRSFGLLGPSNALRKTVGWIVSSPYFDNFILVCILVTSLTLIVELPDDAIRADGCPGAPAVLDCSGLPLGQTQEVNCPRGEGDADFGRVWAACGEEGEAPCCATARKMAVLQSMDLVFTCIFTAEMALKMVVEGLALHPRAYLRDSWNVLDVSIVVIAWLTAFVDVGGVSKSIKSLRAIRALRPLRVIKRNPGLRIAVVCLLSSLPSVFGVAVVVVLWFSMYAMLGVQFFKGELYRCYDQEQQLFFGAPFDPLGTFHTQPQPLSGGASVPTIVECVGRTGGRGAWVDRDYSFDSYPQALLTLFEMATTEGWMSVMAAVVDGVEPGVSPLPNFRPWYSVYCIIHLIIGAFVLLNLIVGSIINNYNRIKNFGDGPSPYLTREQQDWIDTQKLVSQLKPKSRKVGPTNRMRAAMYRVVVHPYFDIAVTCCIIGNMLAMMTRSHDPPRCYGAVMFYINLFFTTVFVLEAVVKLIGLGPRWYFMDGWNRFDITVTVLSVCMTVIDITNGEYRCDGGSADGIPSLQILRTFRIARVFRLIRRARGLKQMIQTLIISLPALGNIGALIMLFITIFAVLGTTAFYNVNLEQDLYGHLDANGNYRTFDNALWILFRQTTGEAWNGIMYYTSQSDPYKACLLRYGDYLGEGCGGPVTGVLFHLVWQLFGTYVLMQLFTAVILENFDDLAKEDMGVVPIDKLHHFVDVWTEFDPSAREKISAERLPALIASLLPPLGVKPELPGHLATPTRGELMLVIKDLPIPIVNGHIRYRDTFLGCVRRVIALELHHRREDEDDVPDPSLPPGLSSSPLASHRPSLDSHRQPHSARTHSLSAHPTASSSAARAASSSPRSPPVGSSPMFRGRPPTVAEDYAARIVQFAFREFKEQRLQVQKGVQRTRYLPLTPLDEPLVAW